MDWLILDVLVLEVGGTRPRSLLISALAMIQTVLNNLTITYTQSLEIFGILKSTLGSTS